MINYTKHQKHLPPYKTIQKIKHQNYTEIKVKYKGEGTSITLRISKITKMGWQSVKNSGEKIN